MGTRSEALYNAVFSDIMEYSPLLPVGVSEIPPDASLSDFRCLVLLRTLLKKWVPRDTTKPDSVAKEKFLASNKRCRDWAFTPEFESDRVLFGEFRKELDMFFHPRGQIRLESWEDILSEARVGPGSAVSATGQSMYAKLFASPLTMTSENLYLMYRLYVGQRPRWLHAEQVRHSQHGSPTVINCSKTSFVPKTVDTSRMICVEPSLNMFFQLGLGRLMENWLTESFGISMADQPDVNRRLARVGSLDNSIATIDLSSASDSISLRLCQEVLPGWLYAILYELRSPSTLVDGEEVRLEMMSTMGNGFTFPLQTILFSSIIRAAHRVAGIPVYDGGEKRNWSCFGDDLICDARASRLVLRLLSLTGFLPNGSKTFVEGPFRESCGTDWLLGQPVRGVYLKRLDSPQDLCVAINLLNEWSAVSGVPLRRGINQLQLWLGRNFLPVPYADGMNSGVRVPRSFLKRECYRWDANLSILYRRYESRPVFIHVRGEGLVTPRGVKKLSYNPEGLYCSFIFGELRNGSYMIRHDPVRYRTKQVCTPYWDYAPTDVPLDRGVASWRRWEIAVLINMSNP
jgi:hypothetical protein